MLFDSVVVFLFIVFLVVLVTNGASRKESFVTAKDYALVARNELSNEKDITALRPWNDVNTRTSMAQVNSPVIDDFDNNYFNLWKSDFKAERKAIADNIKALGADGDRCTSYENINQCMSKCTDTNFCVGFYTKDDNVCCMMEAPARPYGRYSYSDNNAKKKNIEVEANILFNEMVNKRAANKVWRLAGYDKDGRSIYGTDGKGIKECNELCPKCVNDRCPTGYRCRNLRLESDVNWGRNNKCMITNEDRYDEDAGNTFDGPEINPLRPNI